MLEVTMQARYCRCGAVLPTWSTIRALAEWRDEHSGEGHGPTDAKTATQSRRRERRAAERAQAEAAA